MRTAGILLPITSLPSPHGVGTLGRAAFDFIDFLAEAGQTAWQILPVGPTGFGDSPYQSFSSMAGSPYLIDLDLLEANDLLKPGEIGRGWGSTPRLVDYGLLYRKRLEVLTKACARVNKALPLYREFCERNSGWLEDYALFMAIKEAHGNVGFWEWPETLQQREPTALKEAAIRWAPRVEFWRCTQFLFYYQWQSLKRYAFARGIQIVGDIPIYVSPDSSDFWAHPELFLTDSTGRPNPVAGVPPDGFSAEGQLWGNPLYNWPVHQRTGYAWWIERLRHTATLFDVTRLDHFRGLYSYYSIPAGSEDAKAGTWRPGPGKDFVQAIHRALPNMAIIAEDLGYLNDDVRELLAYSGYPGMEVLQFAFDVREESDYLPHNFTHHSVVYTGTHDNATTEEWRRQVPPADLAYARRYLGLTARQSFSRGMVRAAFASVAETAIIPLQDWLGLGAEARINTPSTLGGRNWRWRLLPGQITPALAKHIYAETVLYGRLSEAASKRDAMRLRMEALQALTPADEERPATPPMGLEPNRPRTEQEGGEED